MRLKDLMRTLWFKPINFVMSGIYRLFGCDTESELMLVTKTKLTVVV